MKKINIHLAMAGISPLQDRIDCHFNKYDAQYAYALQCIFFILALKALVSILH